MRLLLDPLFMNSKLINRLRDLSLSSKRNKLVVTQKPLELIPVNVGKLLAQCALELDLKDSYFSHLFSTKLHTILQSEIKSHKEIGSYLYLKNLGILFENKVAINIASLLDTYSKNNLLIIEWVGAIKNDNLYFLSEEKGEKVELKNTNFIVV